MHTTTPPANTSAPTGTHSRGPRIFPGGDPQPLTARRTAAQDPPRTSRMLRTGAARRCTAETETESGKSRATRNVAAAFSGLFSRAPVRGIRAEHARNDFVRAFLRPDNDETDKRGLFSPFRKSRSVFRIRKPHFRLRPNGSGTDPHARKTATPARPGTRSDNARSPPLHLPSAATAPETKKDDCRIRRPHPHRNENRGTRSPRLAKRNFPGDGLER